MLFSWVNVAHDHRELAMPEHGRERYDVNATLRGSRGPGVTEIVQAKRFDYATLDCGGVGGVHLNQRPAFEKIFNESIRFLDS
jgi:hypothetical protein